jgi:hypothetical protein
MKKIFNRFKVMHEAGARTRIETNRANLAIPA